MPLLSPARIARARSALERTLTHTCTLQAMTTGGEDSEGNATSTTSGNPVSGVRCRFEIRQTSSRDPGGVSLVSVPMLTVSATLAIATGAQVSGITDSLGGTPPGATGTFRVERVLEDTAGLGAALLPVYELRGARAVS